MTTFKAYKLFKSPPTSLVNKWTDYILQLPKKKIKVFPMLENVYPHQKGTETSHPCHWSQFPGISQNMTDNQMKKRHFSGEQGREVSHTFCRREEGRGRGGQALADKEGNLVYCRHRWDLKPRSQNGPPSKA